MHFPLIVAHRGASDDAPENTLAAFRLAWEQGADAIEGDFRVTADGHVVCVHDPTTGRCGDRDRVVATRTLAELKRIDVGRWKSASFAGERIPTLGEVLATVPPGRAAYLELKADAAALPALFNAIAAAAFATNRLRLISFDAAAISLAKQTLPQVAADWLIEYGDDGPPAPPVETIIATLRRCRADGLGTEARPSVVTPAFGAAIREAGFALHCWTVNDGATADAMRAAGVHSMTTDRPGWLRRHLAAAP